jgi:hypothetical protein
MFSELAKYGEFGVGGGLKSFCLNLLLIRIMAESPLFETLKPWWMTQMMCIARSVRHGYSLLNPVDPLPRYITVRYSDHAPKC